MKEGEREGEGEFREERGRRRVEEEVGRDGKRRGGEEKSSEGNCSLGQLTVNDRRSYTCFLQPQGVKISCGISCYRDNDILYILHHMTVT